LVYQKGRGSEDVEESHGDNPLNSLSHSRGAVQLVTQASSPSPFMSAFQRVLTSREIKLKNKQANVAGLQLADCLAHPLTAYPRDLSWKQVRETLRSEFKQSVSRDGTIFYHYEKIRLDVQVNQDGQVLVVIVY
jgi:hypothetical protein